MLACPIRTMQTDKLRLAEEVKKDPTPYEEKDGVITFGNPYAGFVGNMYSFKIPGFAVYHGPISELAESYLPEQIIDMTGSAFEDILYAVERGTPV